MFESIKRLFARNSPSTPRSFQDADLGLLTADDDVWEARSQHAGESLSIWIAGSDKAPDVVLLERARGVVARLEGYVRLAIDFFVCEQQSPDSEWARWRDTPVAEGGSSKPAPAYFDPRGLSLCAIAFTCEDSPSKFVMEFLVDGDDDGVWRVEFEAGQPKLLGRDD